MDKQRILAHRKRIAAIVAASLVVIEMILIAFFGISALWNLIGWWPWKWDQQYSISTILFLSSQAAYTLPLFHIFQDRQAARERKRDDQASTVLASHVVLLQQQGEILQLLRDQKASQADDAPDLAKAAFCAYMSDPTAAWEKVSPPEQRRWSAVVHEIRRDRC